MNSSSADVARHNLTQSEDPCFWVENCHLSLTVGAESQELEHLEVLRLVLRVFIILNLNNFPLVQHQIRRNHTFRLIHKLFFRFSGAVADGWKAFAAGDAIFVFDLDVVPEPVLVEFIFAGVEQQVVVAFAFVDFVAFHQFLQELRHLLVLIIFHILIFVRWVSVRGLRFRLNRIILLFKRNNNWIKQRCLKLLFTFLYTIHFALLYLFYPGIFFIIRTTNILVIQLVHLKF